MSWRHSISLTSSSSKYCLFLSLSKPILGLNPVILGVEADFTKADFPIFDQEAFIPPQSSSISDAPLLPSLPLQSMLTVPCITLHVVTLLMTGICFIHPVPMLSHFPLDSKHYCSHYIVAYFNGPVYSTIIILPTQ